MAGPVQDREAMIAGMTPELQPGRYLFAAAPPGLTDAPASAFASFREAEGLTMILPEAEARALGTSTGPAMCCITLMVYSSLEGFGLTAAVVTELAEARIACNMVAGLHHDHAFVPADRAEEALALLKALQSRTLADLASRDGIGR